MWQDAFFFKLIKPWIHCLRFLVTLWVIIVLMFALVIILWIVYNSGFS